MKRILKLFFFVAIVRPFLLIFSGANIRHRERLLTNGPAIIIANHNSHLDTLVLMSLFPLNRLMSIRPVAAQDYFFRNAVFKFFSTNLIGIIPLMRTMKKQADDPFQECTDSLTQGDILILFPEGSRGEPERISKFKSGIARLVEKNQNVPVQPIFMHGLGKILPRGSFLPVPFFCDVFLGEPIRWTGQRNDFMQKLKSAIEELEGEGEFPGWT